MEHLTIPFVWFDVAVVHVVCALPLAWLLAASINRRLSLAGSLGLAICLLGLSVLPMLGGFRGSILDVLLAYPLVGALLRTAVALGLTFPATLLYQVLARHHSPGNHWSAAVAGLAAVVALLLPWTYVAARVRHDLDRLGELVALSRVGEARTLANSLLALDAGRTWNGYPLDEVAADIDRTTSELESRVTVPLAGQATAQQRLDRARELAMLGRSEAAIDCLQRVQDPSLAPEAANLLGTICENQNAWDESLEAFTAARLAWQSQPSSAAQAAGLLQAIRGVAYSQRKLGYYDRAEAAYQELLALSPTADSHFLLAQFYEDTQQAEQARVHARSAMALAPDVYGQKGGKLIRKLSVYHFGCLGVHRAESGR
jgi:tetratricopeptide (TPR) repeat protein